MRTLGTLTLALSASLLACAEPTESNPAGDRPAVPAPSLRAEISRFDPSDGFLLHTIPDLGITFTLGLVEPLSELQECGGPPAFIRTDTRGAGLTVVLPPGPIHDGFRIQGTMVLYDAVIFDFADLCGLESAEIGRGLATFTNNDNDLALYGGRADSFGGVITAVLDLVGGGKAKLLILTRGVVSPDGSFRQVVDRYELKPLGR
jgi:hypothetical protein